ncbi:cadherin-related tumor suppressor-like [Mizuhopecten yessoensis]|uniref:cadherin-related tumor suppressor-like n=1 Tax=Mizuhopecten yessoensis TaxID=6573 RepID=UPI000B45E56D|nr:cadherin-related tumor suppressor-like [Mizuhopecten yessoensis]
MISFWHMLLLPLLFGLSEQDVVSNTGCPRSGRLDLHTIPENLPTGTELIIFTSIRNIALSGPESSHFNVIAKGVNEYGVTVLRPYDFENQSSSSSFKDVSFACTQVNGSVVQGNIQFVVTNVIESSPDFGRSDHSHFVIPENSPINTTVGTLHVTVADKYVSTFVNFGLINTGTPFKVGWPPNNQPDRYLTAVISVQDPALLNYEKTTYYTLTVTATVSDTNITSTATVYINVTDVDDIPPKFDQNGYNVTVAEAMYSSKEIIKLVARDKDAGQKHTILYSLVRVFPQTTLFRIVNTTGQVLVNGTMDREKCDNYLLLIKAFQIDKPDLRMDMTTLKVTVLDKDDNPPVMAQTQYTTRIPENTPTGTNVLTVIATDADQGANAEFHYKIKQQGNLGAFSINQSSGLISVNNGSFLDRETTPTWTFTVFAESTQNSSMRSKEANITVILLDENDNNPVFNASNHTFLVNKTLSILGHIGTVRASDSDESNNGQIVYRLEGDESRRFNVSTEGGFGNIQAVAALSSAYKPWYRFTVVASDMASIGYRRQTSAQVDVRVIDENVNTPAFVNMTTNISVPEDIDIGRDVLLLQAYDEDTSDDLTFMFGNVSDFKLHRVDNRRAMIVINKALDRESRPGHILTVKVTDSVHTSTVTLSINIEDVNDNAPVFQPSSYNFTVDEEVSPTFIGSVTATDKDLFENGMLHYSVLPPWGRNFSITESGQFNVTSSLDWETLSATSGQITLLVMATDGGTPPLMATAVVTVQVKDVNDHAPSFMDNETNITMNEGQKVYFPIKAYDEDEGANGRIYYSIEETNATSVDVTKGTLMSTAALTYGVYQVEVIAYNTVPYSTRGLSNGTLIVYIHVKDINDHSPQFTNTTYTFSLREDFEVGHLVTQSNIHAEDKDETREYNTVTYSVVSGNGYFEVDPLNAALRLIKPLDYEDKHQITFQVNASDGDMNHRVKVNVSVTVLDVNDNAPVFSSALYNCTVVENATLPINCSELIEASDNDTGNNGHILYQIQRHTEDIFKINNTTGLIRPPSSLDYDTGARTYILTILAMDNGNPKKTGSAVVEVTVKDRNDNPPVIHGPSQFTIPENLPVNTSIGTVFATDADINDVLRFLLTSNTDFHIQKDTGILFLTRMFDYEKEIDRHTQVNVSVSDGTHTVVFPISVDVTNVNDEIPVFVNSSLTPKISEDMDDQSFYIQATDGDIGSLLSYNISTYPNIRISRMSGLVTIEGPVNSRDNDTITFTVSVSDGKHMETATVTVQVIDVNDHAPRFENSTYTFEVKEEVDDAFVGRVTAIDKDPRDLDKLRYSILPPWERNFNISKSGEIRVTSALDRENLTETSGKIIFLIKAEDSGIPPLMSIATLTLHVQDVNDHAPYYTNTVKNIGMDERQNVSFPVEACDEDDGRYGHIYYSITDTNVSSLEITTDGKLISTDTLTYGLYMVEIIAYNVEPYTVHGLTNGSVTVYINVKDINNHGPMFNKTLYEFSLPEDFTVGHLVNESNIQAEDKDETREYNTVTYSVVKDEGYFEIDPFNAALRLIKPLDYEDKHQITFQVIASDGDMNHRVKVNVSVTVLDVNDNAPVFSSELYNCTVDENVTSSINCPVLVNASDVDAGDNGRILYTIEGYTKDTFTINKTTGDIHPSLPLDYDSGVRTYILTILATDNGSPKMTGSSMVKLTVKDKNDNSPVIHGPSQVNIPENLPLKTSVATMFATDADMKDVLSFALSETDTHDLFSVKSDNGLGYVILNKQLDREVNASYSLEISVTDTANHTTSTVLNITVLDVNDNKPEFLEEMYNETVDEGPKSEHLTVDTEATDRDEGPNAELVYSIISQDFGHHFAINSTTGVINVLTSLNREDTSMYTLVIQAADNGDTSLSGTATVFINVDDINDCAPVFLQTTYSATVMEGSPSGTSVIHLTATDKDALPTNRNVSYSIMDYSDLFGVDEDGVLALKQRVVVGTHPTPYVVQVEATDGKYLTTVNVTVAVIDVNDHDPVFNETLYSFSVPENDEFAEAPSALVGVVSATDNDPGTQITYRIMSTDVPVFIISPMNGSITTNGTLDRDQCVNSRYTFTVIATDNGNATRTGFVEVAVTISDVNDNRPVFTSLKYDGNVIENSPVGTEVNVHPAILASDIDAGDNGTDGIVFYLSTDSPFEIRNKTGRIFVKNATLDRETKDTYDLTVWAIDQLGSGKNNSTSLIITLDDANDEPPVFTHNVSVFTCNESVPNSYLVGTIYSSDADINGNETTRYDIDSGGEGRFYIDPIQGDIKVTGGLDREQKANYTLIIRASDGRNFALTIVEIILGDTNDNAPVFPSSPVFINVTESNTSLPGIYKFTAHDADLGENSRLSYFINKNDSDYSIFAVSEDGILNTSKPLDRETNATYTFRVYVRDHGTPSLSSSVRVICHVLDTNDNFPIFYDSQDKPITEYRTSILEKSPVNSPVFFPYVKDKDLDKNSLVHFRLVGIESDLFQCNYNTGVVTIAKRIEINSLIGGGKGYKNTTDYIDIVLAVEAADEGDPSKSTNLTLHVTVEQISDENPVFDKAMYDFSVPESMANGSYVGVVTAMMPNVTSYHLTYSLVIPTHILVLDKASGNITLNSTLDREESESHTFAVQVTDGKTPERTAFTMVNIHVTDVNDNAPQFQFLPYVFTVTEGIDVILDIEAVSAIDKDAGCNAIIHYSLLNYTGDIFGVNDTTGNLIINGTLDRETNQNFNLIVQAADSGLPPLNTTTFVEVEINDINDNSPQFQRTNYTCSVLENAAFQQVCNVSATDDDLGDNGTVVYSIQEENIPFYINPTDGTIWKSGMTDFETMSTYHLTVVAHDLGSPMRSSNVSLIVTVVDVPDTAPHFKRRLYNIYTSPFTPVHSVILNETAGDAGITYTISDGLETFCIDNSSGVISLCKVMDSKKSTYVLEVLAEDDNLTDTAVVVIHLRNEPASFIKSHFTTDVQENQLGGLLLDLNTTEELAGYPVHYTLISVQPEETSNTFAVNETTGEIYCLRKLDRELAETYTLYVSAEVIRSSGRSRRSIGESLGQVTVTVRVGDVNDNPPHFAADTKLIYRVPVNLQLAGKVAELQAFDPDDTSTITYSLVNGTALPFFLESGNNTRILLKSSLKLRSYKLTVTATDEGGLSSYVNITIITIPDADRLTYVIPMAPQEFEKQKQALIANLSSILGVNITVEGYKAHISTEVEPDKTDLLLYANNRTTGRLLSNEELSSIISAKFADIFRLFKCTDVTCYVQTTTVKHSSNLMTAPEIALLTIAVLIFVACLLVIIAGNHIWKQFHEAREQEVKMWELESLRSDVGSQLAVAAINPNMETSFSALDDSVNTPSGLAANTKRTMLYESQELRMDFDNEAFVHEHPVTNGADSGVENDSSSSSNVDDNESPGTEVYPDTDLTEKRVEPEQYKQVAPGPSSSGTERKLLFPPQPKTTVGNQQKVTLHIDMDTGDTDDGDLDLDKDTSSVSREKIRSTDISGESLVGAETSAQSVSLKNDTPLDTTETDINSVLSDTSPSGTLSSDPNIEDLDLDTGEEMVTSF